MQIGAMPEVLAAEPASAEPGAEGGSQRPVSVEKTFLLTVAQRAKEAAAAGGQPSALYQGFPQSLVQDILS